MSDSANGGGNNMAQPPKKELSMEVRLLLAFILMGAVMFLSPYLFPTPKTPPKKDTPAAATSPGSPSPAATDAARTSTAPASTETAAASAPLPANATPQVSLPHFIIDTDLYRIAISNQGATVRSWQLKKYRGNDQKPLELVNTASGLDFPFSLHFPGQKPAANVNWTWYKQTGDPDGLGVTYEFSD